MVSPATVALRREPVLIEGRPTPELPGSDRARALRGQFDVGAARASAELQGVERERAAGRLFTEYDLRAAVLAEQAAPGDANARLYEAGARGGAAAAAPSERGRLMVHRPRVLIVEDDPDTLVILRVNLNASGIEPILAADGRTAIARIQAEDPDAVLLDVLLPGVDGWEVLEELHALVTPCR
jgi:hypothetical protein